MEIIDFINKYCQFLIDDYNFNVVKSVANEYSSTSGDIYLESNELKINIEVERGAIFILFHGKISQTRNDDDYWFDVDVLRSFLQNPSKYTKGNFLPDDFDSYDLEMQKSRTIKEVRYIQDNMPKIIEIFADSRINENIILLKKLRNQRAKIRLG
jgi:hypothetical protein